MRLVITQNVTADGAVEMLTDWFDPSDQDQELAAELRRQDESCDAVLLARADRRHHRTVHNHSYAASSLQKTDAQECWLRPMHRRRTADTT